MRLFFYLSASLILLMSGALAQINSSYLNPFKSTDLSFSSGAMWNDTLQGNPPAEADTIEMHTPGEWLLPLELSVKTDSVPQTEAMPQPLLPENAEQANDTLPGVSMEIEGPLPATVAQENDTLPALTPLVPDTLLAERLDPVVITPAEASEFILQLIGLDELWKERDDTLRLSLKRMIDQYNEPYDSIKGRLKRFRAESVTFRTEQITLYDTLNIMWLTDSTFIPDSPLLTGKPLITQKTVMVSAADTSALELRAQITGLENILDSLLFVSDTITEVFIDTLFLEANKIPLYWFENGQITPPVSTPVRNRHVRFSADSTRIYIPEVRQVIMADEDSPFRFSPSVHTPDSLYYAISSLLNYMESRDSVLIYFSDLRGRSTPFWLTVDDDDLHRFWVKNSANDSITVWIGNPSKYDITMFLEEDIHLERLEKKMVDDIPITSLRPMRSLISLKPLEEIPVFWTYGMNSAFTMNQTYFSNWARGGESSLSTVLDLRGRAQYNDRARKLTWSSNGRLRYGSIRTAEHGFRTNTDVLEFNSQFNKVLREKIDFSTTFYFKTQVARGFNYPNDSVVVSKFLNPGTFTLGVGIEYKPFKDTRINFSALSYRNTFVLDTTNINQTIHGVEADQRSRQEMGGQLVVNNTINIFDGLRMTNAVRMFSSYLDKPKNVDVDWEINLERQISWYFSVRLNFHVIYDDDIRFPVLGADGEPLLDDAGNPRRAPKAQLKQFLGLTLALTL